MTQRWIAFAFAAPLTVVLLLLAAFVLRSRTHPAPVIETRLPAGRTSIRDRSSLVHAR